MFETPVGGIDAPLAHQTLDGPAIAMWGWVVFPDEHVDFVDVFLNGEYVGRAGSAYARPDILELVPGSGVNGLTAGFRTLLPLPITESDAEYRIHVRATAADGAVWHSPEVPFTVLGVKDDGVLCDELPDFVSSAPRKPLSAPRWCVFTHSLRLGGGELYLQELLLRVRAATAAEILVVSPSTGPLKEELEEAGITVHITPGYPVSPDHYDGRLVELALLLRSWCADVAVVNTLGLFQAADAARLAGIPAIWAIHESFDLNVFSYLNWGPAGLTPAARARWVEVLKSAELVYEADSTLELHAKAVPGISARKVRYGIDLDRIADYQATHDRGTLRESLGFDECDRVLLCMGVIQERKGQIPLLRAFLDISHEFPEAKLVFVGDHDAPYPAALRECVRLLDASHQVRTVNIDPDTYQWYLAADTLVSASDIESLPRSILEAQAFGLPVLASDVFGVGEVVVDGSTGWLFEPLQASAMVVALARALRTSDAELRGFSERARAAGARHDGGGYARAYIELVNEVSGRSEATIAPEDAGA